MMTIVEGPPGAGKSYHCVRKIVFALQAGKPVAANVALTEGWQQQIARGNPLRRLRRGAVDRAAERFDLNYFSSADVAELMNVRLKGDKKKESRGLLVLDEAHVWLNARTWNSGDREKFLRFFSAHRHLGWDILLITQRAESIDAQIRALAEYRITLRNLKRVKVMGLSLFPVNFFVGIKAWMANGEVVGREFYGLSKGIARLYNSLALADAEDLIPEDVIWLERDREVAPATVLGPGVIDGTWLDDDDQEPAPDEHSDIGGTDGRTDARTRSGRAAARPPAQPNGTAPTESDPWAAAAVFSSASTTTELDDPTRGAFIDDAPDVDAAAELDDRGESRA